MASWATVTPGNVTRHCRRPGTRRPDMCSSTVRCRRAPNPAPRPAQTMPPDSMTPSHWHGTVHTLRPPYPALPSPSRITTAPRCLMRVANRRSGPAAASAGTRANTMSKPSTDGGHHLDPRRRRQRRRVRAARGNRVIGSRRGHGNGDHSFESDAHFARRIEPERRDVDHRQPRSAGDCGRDHRHPGGGGSRAGAGQRPATHQCTLREQGGESRGHRHRLLVRQDVRLHPLDGARKSGLDSQLHPSQRIEQTFDAPGVEAVNRRAQADLAAQRSRAARLRSSRCHGDALGGLGERWHPRHRRHRRHHWQRARPRPRIRRRARPRTPAVPCRAASTGTDCAPRRRARTER